MVGRREEETHVAPIDQGPSMLGLGNVGHPFGDQHRPFEATPVVDAEGVDHHIPHAVERVGGEGLRVLLMVLLEKVVPVVAHRVFHNWHHRGRLPKDICSVARGFPTLPPEEGVGAESECRRDDNGEERKGASRPCAPFCNVSCTSSLGRPLGRPLGPALWRLFSVGAFAGGVVDT